MVAKGLEYTGFTEVGLLSLSSADHSEIADICTGLADRYAGANVSLSLPSTRVVKRLSGPVGTPRSDVDWVVTEHGARSLKGLSDDQRSAALLELAGAADAETLAV